MKESICANTHVHFHKTFASFFGLIYNIFVKETDKMGVYHFTFEAIKNVSQSALPDISDARAGVLIL